MKLQIKVGNQSFVVDDSIKVAVLKKVIDAYDPKASANKTFRGLVKVVDDSKQMTVLKKVIDAYDPKASANKTFRELVKVAIDEKKIDLDQVHSLFKQPIRERRFQRIKNANKERKKNISVSEEQKYYSAAISKLVQSDEITANLMKGAIAKAKARKDAEAKLK